MRLHKGSVPGGVPERPDGFKEPQRGINRIVLRDLPGVGKLLVTSIGSKDYPMVQAGVVFLAVVYVALSVFVDVLYGVLDPRIRLHAART